MILFDFMWTVPVWITLWVLACISHQEYLKQYNESQEARARYIAKRNYRNINNELC